VSTSVCDRTRRTGEGRIEGLDPTALIFRRKPGVRYHIPICPLHGEELREDTELLALNLVPAARAEYPAWVAVHAPCAEMPLDSMLTGYPWPRKGSLAAVCVVCRETALDWIAFRQFASVGPESDWELPPSGVRPIHHSEAEYRSLYPRSKFVCVFDGFESRKDILTSSELDAVYEKTVRARLFDIPQRHPEYPEATRNAIVRADRARLLYFQCGDRYRTYSWYDERAPRDPEAGSEWARLLDVYAYVTTVPARRKGR
jgi:hypothetical protein